MNSSDTNNSIERLLTMDYIYDAIESMSGENDDVFKKVASLALHITGGENCLIALRHKGSGSRFKVIATQPVSDCQKDSIPPAFENLFTDVVRGKEALLAGPDQTFPSPVICAPLMIRGKVFGVMGVTGKQNGTCLNTGDLGHIRTLTKRASLNMENNILYESVYSNITYTFQSLITSIHLRDNYTQKHSSNVTVFAVNTARSLNCSEKEVESVRIAGMLHDIGKIAIPDNILLKTGQLTNQEYTVIKEHPVIGENILKAVALMDTEREIILHHHERWDGRGYPGGLSGEEIPFLSRILSVADSFDAMTTNRPYRNALPTDIAVSELQKNCGTQFDSKVVKTFISHYCRLS